MNETFQFDVFLSCSSRDNAIVSLLAEGLKQSGLRVWFGPDDPTPESLLEQSRVLALCMSANLSGPEWATLESQTYRFRDPLNKDRRFVLLRLDDTPPKGSLAQFAWIDWRPAAQSESFSRLLEACRAPKQKPVAELEEARRRFEEKVQSLGHTGGVNSVAFSPDGHHALSGSVDKTVRLWELSSGRTLRVLEGHKRWVWSVAFSGDGERALSGSEDKTVRLWELSSGRALRILEGHTASVRSVAFSRDGERALSGSDDKTVRLWELSSGRVLRVLEGHTASVWSVAFSGDGERALSGSEDKTVRLWELSSGRALGVLEGHTASVRSVAFSPDGERALSGSEDKTVRLWELSSGRALRILEGHMASVRSVAFSGDGERALSGSEDKTVRLWELSSGRALQVLEGHTASVRSVTFSGDGERALSGSEDTTVRLWELSSGRVLRVLEGHTSWVLSVAFSGDGERALSSSEDKTVRLWELSSGRVLGVLAGHTSWVWSVAFSGDGERALSGSEDKTVRLWELSSGRALRVLEGHTDSVRSVAFSEDGERALSGSEDKTVRLWELSSGRALQVLEGHTASVRSVAFSGDGERALSGSEDKTVRLWELSSGRALRVLEGHTASVSSVAFSGDGEQVLSGSEDKTVRLWELSSGRALRVLDGHTAGVLSVAFSPDGRHAFSAAANGVSRVWNLEDVESVPAAGEKYESVQYTNAKVLLVGDTGVGKTGLARYLALNIPDDGRNVSTDGAWARQWTLPHTQTEENVDREIWLWDFAGQVDYRLVHQLFMEETAAAVVVFNPQDENPFEGLGQWDRDLQKATRKPFARLLAAGRIDRGGLVVSRAGVERFMQERGFVPPLHETSARTGAGCDELRDAIVRAIEWRQIPVTTSRTLYHRMKEEVLKLRDNGPAVIRLAEMKQRMEVALPGANFTPDELQTVVSLLAGPGMIQNAGFGDIVLLKPEVLSRYAAALVRKVRKHPQELGCIKESEMLAGELDYQDFTRLPEDQEKIVLKALYETLVSRAWCLKQVLDGSIVLTFPSYFRRERPERPSHPSVFLSYRFAGPVDDIYATLVVRLHYTPAFDTDQLWRFAADFKTPTEKGLGVALSREPEGGARLDIYSDVDVSEDSRVLFAKYIDSHLKEHAQDVVRLRYYSCPNKKCKAYGAPVADRTAIDAALASGEKKIFCPRCGKPILLQDTMEKKFESSKTGAEVRELQAEVRQILDNESRELLLVGHAYTITAEAGQIYRGYTNSDHGIDGEIEFKDNNGDATGKRLYLQLKSGDSYLKKRARDEAEIFQIKKARWADYWQQQAYHVMLVIRNSKGETQWMDVTTYLRREGKEIKQIIFEGERFDAASVIRWRKGVLGL